MRSKKGNTAIMHPVALNSLQKKGFALWQREVLLTCRPKSGSHNLPKVGQGAAPRAIQCSPLLTLLLGSLTAPGQFSEPEFIIHTLKYHVVKQAIPQKDVLPLGTSVQFLATFLSFLHSTVCPIWGDLWCSAGEAARRRIYSSSFHCCCSGRLSPTPSVLTLGKSNDGLWKYTIKLLWKLVSSCVHSKFLPVWGWRRGCRLLYTQTTKQEGTERKSICSNTSPPSFSSQYKFNPPYTRRGELVQHNIMEQFHFTETLQKAESLWDQSL